MKKNYEIIGDVRGLGISIGVDLAANRGFREKQKKQQLKLVIALGKKV